MLTTKQIRDLLKDANLAKVSRGSGVCYQVVVRLMQGRSILSVSLEKLSRYLEVNDEI